MATIVAIRVYRVNGNIAHYAGGGIFIAMSNTECSPELCAEESTLTDKVRDSYASRMTTKNELAYQTFKDNVIFVDNAARLGGGLTVFSSNMLFSGKVAFYKNSALLSDDTFGLGGGIFSYFSILNFMVKTYFVRNSAFDGGGLYGSKTRLSINYNLKVVENTAIINGGGFYFAGGSECWLSDNASMRLTHNHAGQLGGAIYIRDDPFIYCIMTQDFVNSREYHANCLFQPTKIPTKAAVILGGNHAGEAGSELYGGILDKCRRSACNISSTDGVPVYLEIDNDTTSTSFISSDPIRVCPCDFSKVQCHITNRNLTAFPGEVLHISVVATGQKNGTVPSVVTAKFANRGMVLDSGQDVQLTNNTCTTLNYRILPQVGPNTFEYAIMSLHPSSPCQSYTIPLQVSIHLLPCPSGFELSKTPYMLCICSKRVQQYTNTCDIDTQTLLRHGQYWIGWDAKSSGAILHPHCPFDYCKPGNTSFPMNDTDRQCHYNRAGILCGGCEHGFSIGFGSSQCLQCSSNSYLSLILAFILAGAILVIFLLTCKLTVAVGTINGLIFYANIVAANQALYFPNHNSEGAFLRIFIAWINLDLGIETCFYHGMDTYTWTWLQFVFPLYIWTLVGIVIVLSHYFVLATKLFGNNPVAVLATLFLLSYSKILRTIITAMSFTYLDYPDNPRVPVWLYDGNIRYLEGKHIALFVAALLALCGLFLPYTTVIFCGQCIKARSQHKLFRWVDDYRVKPFLDAYHGPLKSNHSYWPGLLLVTRALLLLVLAFNAFGDPSINLLATITCAVGLLTLLSITGGIYNQTHLHLLEISFLVNTLVLAACKTVTLTGRIQVVLTCISVGIAFATFIGILVYHTLIQVRDLRLWKDTIRRRLWCIQRTKPLAEPDEVDGRSVVAHPAIPTTTYVELRELLLEDEHNL